MQPEHIGPYRIIRQLGQGGMGIVYEALHEQIQRRAAIKVLLPDVSRDPETAARFFNEARAVNIIRHPGIVSISELGQLPDGCAYIVMEYLEGESLRARMARGMLKASGLRVIRQMAAALAAAHDKGIIHRDLKPDNVMLVSDADVIGGERAKVLDFGIAKLAAEHKHPETGKQKTSTGASLGTATYMSPEQCRGDRAISDRTDVYALGVILYEMLAGKPPFDAEGWGALIGMHIYESPRPLQELDANADPRLVALVHRMLAKEPDTRPRMSELVNQLDAMMSSLSGSEGRLQPTGAASADAAPSNPKQNITMGGASGQAEQRTTARAGARKGVALLLAGAVAVAAAAWIAHEQLRKPSAPVVAMPTPVTPAGESGSGTASARNPPAAAPARPGPSLVRWSLSSEPSGAQVLRATDKQPLGTTPWQLEQTPGGGKVQLVLRAKGFADKSVELDRSLSSERHEVLAALGGGRGSAGSGRRSASSAVASAGKPAAARSRPVPPPAVGKHEPRQKPIKATGNLSEKAEKRSDVEFLP